MTLPAERTRGTDMSEKTRVFCHCHVYYPELWPQLRGALRNLAAAGCRLRVALTTVVPLPAVEEECRREFPDTEATVVPNRGYDILPFFRVWEDVRPGDFDLVLKLHTKRDCPEPCMHVNGFSGRGPRLRDMLLEFLATPENAQMSLRRFDDPRVGMVGNGRLWIDYDRDRIEWDRRFIGDELRRFGMTTRERAFLSGTMFLCRPRVLERFRGRIDCERLSVRNDHAISVIHCYEMLFGCAVAEAGLRFCDYAGRPAAELHGGKLRMLWFGLLYKLCRIRNVLTPRHRRGI